MIFTLASLRGCVTDPALSLYLSEIGNDARSRQNEDHGLQTEYAPLTHQTIFFFHESAGTDLLQSTTHEATLLFAAKLNQSKGPRIFINLIQRTRTSSL